MHYFYRYYYEAMGSDLGGDGYIKLGVKILNTTPFTQSQTTNAHNEIQSIAISSVQKNEIQVSRLKSYNF